MAVDVRFNPSFRRKLRGVEDDLQQAMRQEAVAVERALEANTPVVTGRLLSGWRRIVRRLFFEVSNSTVYAIYVDARRRIVDRSVSAREIVQDIERRYKRLLRRRR